jgi:hypothetical protein
MASEMCFKCIIWCKSENGDTFTAPYCLWGESCPYISHCPFSHPIKYFDEEGNLMYGTVPRQLCPKNNICNDEQCNLFHPRDVYCHKMLIGINCTWDCQYNHRPPMCIH